MIAHLAQTSTSHIESRRRTSRRNHYLRDIVQDMKMVDSIQEFGMYPLSGATDEIVPPSASQSPHNP